jgi:predicted amidohydrolase
MSIIKVAAAQPISVPGNISKNVETLCQYLDSSKNMNVDLVIFPELFLCDLDVEALLKDAKSMSVSLDDPEIEKIQEHCRKKGISTIFGACLDCSGELRNSAIVIGSNGEILGTYDKINLWREELRVHTPGDQLQIFEIAGFKIGIAICIDAGFPEHIRALALEGAEVIACLNAFSPGEEEHRYHLYWPLRALENTVYVVTANLIGEAGSRTHFGKSAIFDPTGRLLERANSSEALIAAVLTKNRIAQVRSEITYLEDLRREIYSDCRV